MTENSTYFLATVVDAIDGQVVKEVGAFRRHEDAWIALEVGEEVPMVWMAFCPLFGRIEELPDRHVFESLEEFDVELPRKWQEYQEERRLEEERQRQEVEEWGRRQPELARQAWAKLTEDQAALLKLEIPLEHSIDLRREMLTVLLRLSPEEVKALDLTWLEESLLQTFYGHTFRGLAKLADELSADAERFGLREAAGSVSQAE